MGIVGVGLVLGTMDRWAGRVGGTGLLGALGERSIDPRRTLGTTSHSHVNEKFGRRKSPSGLLCCEIESIDLDGVFLRMGLDPSGGRFSSRSGPSRLIGSRGICVTE